MKPSDLLVATGSADGKSIRILPKERVTHLYFVGHSEHVVSGARPGEQQGSLHLSLSTQDSYSGIVVLRVDYTLGGARNYPSVDLYLVVQFKDGGLVVNLEREFIPVDEIIPQVVYGDLDGIHGLRVLIDGVYYTSVQDRKPSDERYVPNTNLLVSYLTGDASKDDVIAAAEAHVAEVTAREQLEKCKVQLDGFRRVFGRSDSVEPVLCFVHGNDAYFTTQELSRQTGDNWNVAPHSENAGIPHVAPKGPSGPSRGALQWDVVRVSWMGPFEVVTDFEGKSLSVDNINYEFGSWLMQIKDNENKVYIRAGIFINEFMTIIKRFGGTVTVEEIL